MKNSKKGISLIVLIITIILIVILATAILVSVISNNPISEANKARYESDRDNMQAVFTNTVGKIMAENQGVVNVTAGQINTETADVTEATGEVAYTVDNAMVAANASGTIKFDKGTNDATTYYTGKKLPIYAAGETKWYVDSEGVLTLEVAGVKYGSAEVESGNSSSEETLAPGLYDENGVMIMNWEEFINSKVQVQCDCGSPLGEQMDAFRVENDVFLSNEYKDLEQQSVDCCGPYYYNYSISNKLNEYANIKIVFDPSIAIVDSVFNFCNLNSFCYEIVITTPISETAGLYDDNGNKTMSWQQLIDERILYISGGILYADSDVDTAPNEGKAWDKLDGKLVIADSVVREIGYGAFNDCKKLTSIEIPNSVTKIENYAFIGCTSLKTVNFMGTENEWNNISIGTSNGYLTNATINFLGE